MNNILVKRTITAIIVVMMLFALCACSRHGISEAVPSSSPEASPVPATKAPAAETAAPTAAPAPTATPVPTAAPAEDKTGGWEVIAADSIKAEYTALMEEFLAGGAPDLSPLKNPTNKPEYWFDDPGRFEGGWLGAFSSYLYLSNDDGGERDHYLCLHRAASFPLETYKAAVEKIIEYRKQYWGVDSVITEGTEESFGFAPIAGFCGEDWFVLPDWEVVSNRQAHTIWRTDDGEHYYEFGAKNGELGELTDALIVSDKVGYLCCTGWDYEDGCGFRVFVTRDGGESWDALGLEVPEELAGYVSSFAFAPVFDGERGALAVRLAFMDDGSDDARFEIVLFETDDGGITWRFVDE